ncbi:MAG: hypothetical protein WC783_03530 [Candidatus Paceibacterota bacterium]|jgi:hypothetical protein
MTYYIFSGLIGVINMILWGLYGDLLVERFSFVKILRSVLIGILWSILLFIINPDLPLFIVALVVISLERITTEIYKALIRVEDQNKYKIPSDLNIRLAYKLKLFLGLLLILILGTLVYLVEIPINKIYLTLIIGIFIALGGMLKDAPFEGFDSVKFFRSPIVAIIIGTSLLILFPTISGKYFLLATAGGERIISEFYKKIFRGRIPGKFQQKEFNKTWEEKRKLLLFLYVLDIIGLAVLIFV